MYSTIIWLPFSLFIFFFRFFFVCFSETQRSINMGKQTKSRKVQNRGKGKVTPVQIAFIVDRYLADNSYTNTRSAFRDEASDLISRSPVQEAPKTLLSLGAILDEYISLKEQKVMLDQEKSCLEQEKFRIQNLLRGMQDVMNAYNTGVAAVPLPPPIITNSTSLISLVNSTARSGCPVYNTPGCMSASRPLTTPTDTTNFSAPITNLPISKRQRSSNTSDAPMTAKRFCSQPYTKVLQSNDRSVLTQVSSVSNNLQISAIKALPRVNVSSGSPVQRSSVAKCLFNQHSHSNPTNSTVPNTPPRLMSSPTDKSGSSPEVTNAKSSNDVTPQQITSTNCTVIASETITVSPAKQKGFLSIERNCYISSSSPIKTNFKRFSKRDHVKGRLDFDGSGENINQDKPMSCEVTATETEKEVDDLDFDFPNLDVFGEDFSFSELLREFDLDGEGMDYSDQPNMKSSPSSLSGSPQTSENAINSSNQVISELSSTVTEILSEKNNYVPGPDSVTSVKSITKCIKILSPVKNQRSLSQS